MFNSKKAQSFGSHHVPPYQTALRASPEADSSRQKEIRFIPSRTLENNASDQLNNKHMPRLPEPQFTLLEKVLLLSIVSLGLFMAYSLIPG